MKVIHMSRADGGIGGGFRAAHRLHHALRQLGVDDWMWVGLKASDEWSVIGPGSQMGRALAYIRPKIGAAVAKLQRTPGQSARSVSILPSGLATQLNDSDADIVNLHWVNGELLSIEEIGRIRKPLVWTLHDMWPFSGAEHYETDASDARWIAGYRSGNRASGDRGPDIDRWVFSRKVKAWKRPIRVIAPSRWLFDCVRRSALMHQWPVHHVPNPLDTDQFRPISRDLAREVLGLPKDRPLVMFGAFNPSDDKRKGFDLLQSAIERLADVRTAIECVVMGQSEPKDADMLGVRAHWLGRLHDAVSISLAYSAADVVVVPSRADNLPQVATEAQACGVPVVAFKVGGLPDVVDHMETGYLARPFSSEDLAHGIRWVLADEHRRSGLSIKARERAVQLWSPSAVVPQYMEVYAMAQSDASVRDRKL